jgi:hypothetical protein
MSEMVSPYDIVLNGSHHIHGVERVLYSGKQHGLILESEDVAIVVPGAPNPFPSKSAFSVLDCIGDSVVPL